MGCGIYWAGIPCFLLAADLTDAGIRSYAEYACVCVAGWSQRWKELEVEEMKMARLIDADRALEIVRDQRIAHPNAYHLTNYATLILREAPTVDAVPVVRCKDCKFGDWDSEPNDAMVCMRTKDGFWRSGNDFCSFGERKEGAD